MKFKMSDIFYWRKRLNVGDTLTLVKCEPHNKNFSYNVPRLITWKSSTSIELESVSKAKVGFWVDLPTLKTLVSQTEDTFTIYTHGFTHTYKHTPAE